MSRTETLKSLESVLESFLDRVMKLKESRLDVLQGINRLDDIAAGIRAGDDLTDQIGGWFAEHNQWLGDQTIRPAERNRVGRILGEIKREIRISEDSSPAVRKISNEINRWQGVSVPPKPVEGPRQVILRRGPEGTDQPEQDSISLFGESLQRINNLFADVSGNKQHLMSVLDDTLESAIVQLNKEALILSALIIYYLKRNGYKVEPFVKRLKKAERLQEGVG